MFKFIDLVSKVQIIDRNDSFPAYEELYGEYVWNYCGLNDVLEELWN